MATPNQHGSSTSGDPAKMPDGFLTSITDLSLPPASQQLGDYKSGPVASVPGSQEITPREQYDFQSGGEPGLLGQDQDDYASTLKDSAYPTGVPDPTLPGESGATHQEPQGDPLDFNAVAPYRYPEYPMAKPKQDLGGGITSVTPLT